MIKLFKNKCYGYEKCREIIASELSPTHSGSVDLVDRWCGACVVEMYNNSLC